MPVGATGMVEMTRGANVLGRRHFDRLLFAGDSFRSVRHGERSTLCGSALCPEGTILFGCRVP